MDEVLAKLLADPSPELVVTSLQQLELCIQPERRAEFHSFIMMALMDACIYSGLRAMLMVGLVAQAREQMPTAYQSQNTMALMLAQMGHEARTAPSRPCSCTTCQPPEPSN